MGGTKREIILERAAALVAGERDQQYGSPRDNFKRIALIWTAILGIPVTEEQVALCMSGVKIARLAHDPTSMDGWIDSAGYTACGGEIAWEKSRGVNDGG